MSQAIISDSSSLIMAARLGRLDLLTNLFQQIHVPQRVRQEIMAKEDAAIHLLLENPTFTVVATTNHSLLALLDGTLDYGEAEAVAGDETAADPDGHPRIRGRLRGGRLRGQRRPRSPARRRRRVVRHRFGPPQSLKTAPSLRGIAARA